MRRRRLTVGTPGVQAGTIAKAFTDMYNSVPSQGEVDQQQLAMDQARAQTDLYRAQADETRLEAGGVRRQQQGQKRIADLFGGVDLAGQEFNPSGAHPSQQNMVDAPKTDPQNTLGAYQDDELTQAVRGAMQIATGAGMDPVEASTMIRNNAASLGMDPETIQRIGYAADPSYALNENQGVSVADREQVAARNDAQETALNAADNAASMAETRFTAFADPIKAKPDDMVLPHPDDPRTKGYQGAESRLADRIAAGEETTPEQRAMVGADGGSRTPRNYVTPDGSQGTTLDGVTDAATGEPLPQGTTVSTSQLQTDDPDKLNSNVRGNLQEGAIAFNDFQSTLDMLRGIANDGGPEIFGTAGNVRRLGQGAVGQMRAALPGQFEEAQQELIEAGVAPEYFDRDLSDIDKVANLAAYQAASALAQQTGRGLSDKDFQRFRNIIGDPTSWLSTQESFLSGLDRVEELATSMRENRMQALYGDNWRAQMSGGGGSSAPAQQGGQPSGGSGKVIRYDSQGNRIE